MIDQPGQSLLRCCERIRPPDQTPRDPRIPTRPRKKGCNRVADESPSVDGAWRCHAPMPPAAARDREAAGNVAPPLGAYHLPARRFPMQGQSRRATIERDRDLQLIQWCAVIAGLEDDPTAEHGVQQAAGFGHIPAGQGEEKRWSLNRRRGSMRPGYPVPSSRCNGRRMKTHQTAETDPARTSDNQTSADSGVRSETHSALLKLPRR